MRHKSTASESGRVLGSIRAIINFGTNFKTMAEFCGECSTEPNNIGKIDVHDNESDGEEILAPIDRIVIPSDVVTINEDEEFVYVVGTRDGKVTRISGLDTMNNIKVFTNKIFFR